MTAAAQMARTLATTPHALAAGSNDAVADKVRELYAGAWFWLACCYPDAEARLAALPKSGKVAKLEASAARRAARAVRGEGTLAGFASRLREWETTAAATLAKLDQRKEPHV